MNNLPISVLTIAKSRNEALRNLVLGLEMSERYPAELIIVNMNEPASELISENFQVRSFRFDAEEKLPLAAARNFATVQATFPVMIFLDVDCIPSSNLTGKYFDACQESDHLWIGPVRYLTKGATLGHDFLHKMREMSSPDPVRGDLRDVNYALFWSLNFACSKKIYDHIGGFDTRFTGYGAEDTDFGFSARKKSVPLSVVDAVAYHQYHASYDPPLNHFRDILANARTFFDKWKTWPMEGWLRKFEIAGLIELENDEVRILREPEEMEIIAAMKSQ
ncbi:Glycosyltransferase, GT2 family [Dyadobacter koreensis]|uniref:Glycosyltransferase, GT2 family n=1 Tax=Dyadobacter koreensis TaxID=408657 RepID=A0A1H6XC64_9BACT|nr:galactosyltransferase-related protein [Dyadobacter koreensis]SEJ26729.1 Glycosyltransferase, GT2 family [Dyadobacter koreensis]